MDNLASLPVRKEMSSPNSPGLLASGVRARHLDSFRPQAHSGGST